ncbi:MAG: hypothetical protein K0R03_2375 [Moraxellaceae bacterium]|jgi:hypothetical protein|nr:hypothetical protein [Moraxellaceae bacterium]
MSHAHEERKPWYRHPWVWFMLALPASAVIAGIATVVIAVVHQDSLVRDDWYKEGKAINQSIARDSAATRLGLAAGLRIDAVTGEVIVNLRQKNAAAVQPATLTLNFSHPTLASADQSLTLARRDGSYRGQLAQPLKGRYAVELGSPEWRLTGVRDFPREEFSLNHE